MIIYIVVAVGCETFEDGSSVVVLNQTEQCQEISECSGEKEIDVKRTVTECSLLTHKAQYLHKDGWKPLSVKTNSFDVVTNESKTLLKVLTTMT